MLNREINVPPFYTSWNYNPSWRGLGNKVGYALLTWLRKPMQKVINDYRQQGIYPRFAITTNIILSWLNSVNNLRNLNFREKSYRQFSILRVLLVTQRVENRRLFRMKS